jgi:hypothetical protein
MGKFEMDGPIGKLMVQLGFKCFTKKENQSCLLEDDKITFRKDL